MCKFAKRLFAVLACVLAVSCSRLPSRIPMPKLDPATAATEAIALYDQDGDGALSADELEASSGLKSAAAMIDFDQDKQLSADEIETRIAAWLESQQALLVLPCEVRFRGQPLEGAMVRFIPDPFLGEAAKPASAVTDQYGVANVVHAPEDRPDPEFPQGVGVGFYRVEISKEVDGKERLKKKYNSESTLGQEVAPGAAGLGQGMLRFDLR